MTVAASTDTGPAYPGAPWRAAYAVFGPPWNRRRYAEPEAHSRTPFQRDRDRIVHARAFRRLKHKTQVFVAGEGDHYRTRLTHSLEVAQVARSIARTLGLDEDLTEALALAHDLGHTPFGHAGEEALHQAMAAYGGFEHNAQTLRVVTLLEDRYADFPGLNLTVATLDGLIKHNGPVAGHALLPWVAETMAALEIDPACHACLEAQVAALSDDIAYNNHDIDDGLRAGLLTIEGLSDVPLVGDVFRAVRARTPDIAPRKLILEGVRRLISLMIDDVVAESQRRLARAAPKSASEAAAAGNLIGFSAAMTTRAQALKTYLFAEFYRAPRVAEKMAAMKDVVAALFTHYINDPALLPTELHARCAGPRHPQTARVAADFIAGMTDTFALAEIKRLEP